MDEQGTVVRSHTESNEQIAAMDWLRLQHPKIAEHTMHIGNERKATYYAGYIMKRMGVLKGASDLFMAWPSGGYHGLFIEVKSKIGKPTPHQLHFLERMNSVGYMARVCYGAEEIIDTIQEYLGYQPGRSSSTKASS
jgi:hypothetical protein